MVTRKLIVDDGRSERELLIVGTVSVGRDPSCNIHDLDSLLSRRHAEFVWSKQNVTIRDCGSRNGILVNGIKVPEQVLKSGDVVQMGHLHVRYVETSGVVTQEDRTRARERTDTAIETPTMAPTGRIKESIPQEETQAAPMPRRSVNSDLDSTFAAPGRGRDLDATFAAPAARGRDLDATFAGPAGDLDATFAATAPVAPPAAKPATPPRAVEAPSRDLDATFAPGTLARDSANLDATFAPARRPSAAPSRPAMTEVEILVDHQLLVTSASAGCFELFGVRPEALVGSSAAEVVVQSLTSVAASDGPPNVSITVTRIPADRTLTLTFKAGTTGETRS